MLKCIVVHAVDENNVGDMSSNPMQYFLKDDEYKVVDINEVNSVHFEENVPVIIGGGGLIANDFFGDKLRYLLNPSDHNNILDLAERYWQESSTLNKPIRDEFFGKLNSLVLEFINKLDKSKSPRIIWGAGHNGNYTKKFKGDLDYPDWLREFDLVGVRDYAQQYEWAPCASCMHPALQKNYPIKNDIIWFEHKKQILKSTDFGKYPIPRFVNSGNNIEHTIELLGSANTIITNSYHGAYWGTLLKKKVIVVDPWSSKFNCLKNQPTILDSKKTLLDEDWQEAMDTTPIHYNALEESMNATQNYWKKVKGFLE